jgi:hypothetical protein
LRNALHSVNATSVPDWDPRLVRTLLGSVMSYERQLGAILSRAQATRVGLEQARGQVAPHRVELGEVTAHAACEARGCAPCGQSGVAQASTGEPFARRPPVSRSELIAAIAEQRQAQARARAQLEELAGLFGQVARVLQTAARSAAELEREIRALIR